MDPKLVWVYKRTDSLHLLTTAKDSAVAVAAVAMRPRTESVNMREDENAKLVRLTCTAGILFIVPSQPIDAPLCLSLG